MSLNLKSLLSFHRIFFMTDMEVILPANSDVAACPSIFPWEMHHLWATAEQGIASIAFPSEFLMLRDTD